MRDWFRRLLRPAALDDALWQRAIARVPFVAALDPERQTELHTLVSRFLHEKAVTPIGELALDDEQRVELAALCCLPLIEFGDQGLHGWSQLLVYPDAFRVNRTHEDASGVLHEWDDELIGEAWETGPVIVSWTDVQADLASPRDGFCVVVHEIAHKLDALDGVLDGTPPLPRAWQRQWADDFQRAFDDFGKQVDRRRKTAIDPYAAEAPEEFFAVCTEYHFSDPKALRASFPAVAAHLARFYGPSPFA